MFPGCSRSLAKTEGEGLGDLVTYDDVRGTEGRQTEGECLIVV